MRPASRRSSPTARGRSGGRSTWPRPGDVVVIAGKGHERGQEANGVVTPFDDTEVAGEALRALKTTA